MNQVVVSATVSRSTTQQVKIDFGKVGHGDDIVDQWADRMLAGMQFILKSTLEQAGKMVESGDASHSEAATGKPGSPIPAEPVLRTVPDADVASMYYAKLYNCANCQWPQLVWVLRGKASPVSVQCLNCDCKTDTQPT